MSGPSGPRGAGERRPNADRSLSDHVESCAACRTLLEEIRAENDLLGEFLGANADSFMRQLPRRTRSRATDHPRDPPWWPGHRLQTEQVATRRTVAIKMLLQGRFATSKQRHRFERKVEVIAELRHPGIVTLYESGVATGRDLLRHGVRSRHDP